MPLLYEDKSEQDIQLIKDWIEVRSYVENHFKKKPDIQACLFLIGINELGDIRPFSKEEKQDLIHVGMCKVLEGIYFSFEKRDEDNWPHYASLKPLPDMFLKKQEQLLKQVIVKYFQEYVF